MARQRFEQGMGKLSGYLRLMRPINCIMMGFAVIVGATIANPRDLSSSGLSLTYGFITGFLLTAASMTINDYYDRAIDAVNEPKRPIPSGTIKPKEALSFGFALTAIGFVTAFLTNFLANFYSLIIAIIAWAAFVTYTTVGKRRGLTGNFLVSTCVAIPFIYGNFTIANTLKTNVLIFALMAFLSNTGREITKGIVDVQGDKMQNVKTLAVRFGERSAAVAAAIFFLLAVMLSPLPWFLNLVSPWFIPIVAITDFGLIASSIALLQDYSRDNARKVKKTALFLFLVGLLAFIVGVV